MNGKIRYIDLEMVTLGISVHIATAKSKSVGSQRGESFNNI